MKKLKRYLTKMRSVVSVKTFKHPTITIISLILFFNLFVLTISSFITMRIDSNYPTFFEAFTQGSLKWMLTPDSLANITESNTMILAVIVLIMGMVLFSGTIIALTTNIVKEFFEKRKQGRGKIYMDEHVVILNWNNKVPELVADLLHIDNFNVVVCILADIDKIYAEKQIINAINHTQHSKEQLNNLNILVKQGDPLLVEDLEDISIEAARSVIVMNKDLTDSEEVKISSSDLNVIKTVLSVGRLEFAKSPPIVCEIKDIETKSKINTMTSVVETLKDHIIMPICFDRRLGQVIAQTIIHPRMEDVYLSIFSFDGSEVYFLDNTTFGDCIDYHTDALPLARKENGLFVLSEDDETIYMKSDSTVSAVDIKLKDYEDAINLNVYIIGRNNKLDFMLSAFEEYEKLYKKEFQSTWVQPNQLEEVIDDINNSKEIATIILLSEEVEDKALLDASVINDLIYIEGHLKRKDVDIIVELLDPKNDQIIKDFNINNTIISNKIVSLLLSKLALFPETDSFYENLLTLEINENEVDDQEVFIRRYDKIIDDTRTFSSKKSFIKSVYNASQKEIIPFGYIHNDELLLFSNDLHQNDSITFEDDDLLILMKL